MALGIVIALCVRRILNTTPLPYEAVGLLAAMLLLFVGPLQELPLGLGAMLLLSALVVRRGYSKNG